MLWHRVQVEVVVVVGLRGSVLTIRLSPPLHWLMSLVAVEPNSRMAVITADVTLESSDLSRMSKRRRKTRVRKVKGGDSLGERLWRTCCCP